MAIDGGGIRGIIPALILQRLEGMLQQPLAEQLHLVAGSSTGAVLALGLVTPSVGGRPLYSGADLVHLYRNCGKRIFSGTNPFFDTLGQLFRAKYDGCELDKVLYDYFGEISLKDTLTTVLVPSFETSVYSSWLFNSAKTKAGVHNNFYLRDVARASCAAPTYFPPAYVYPADDSEVSYSFVDGGMTANNPAMCALVEAQHMWPDAKHYQVISIGTGQVSQRLPYEDCAGLTMLGWAPKVIDMLMTSASETVDFQLKQLAVSQPERYSYLRIQVDLDGIDPAMDNAEEDHIESLTRLTQHYIQTHPDILLQAASLIRANVSIANKH